MRVFVSALAFIVPAIFVLAGCAIGGSSQTAATNHDRSGASSSKAGAETAGTPQPGALSDFQCRSNDDDEWKATGLLKNRAKDATTFQVTVVVAPESDDGDEGETKDGADKDERSAEHKATRKQFASVQPKDSVRVNMDDLDVPKDVKQEGDQGDDAVCYVQVLAVDD